MKSLKTLTVASVSGLVLAGTLSGTVYAWHPEVKITKYVTNQTAGGQQADANDVASAVGTKPGDTIKYTMVIENPAQPANNGHNDLHFTKLTDTLPAGVELASDPAKRQITEELGILKPGQKITKEYTLKVTSTKDADVISNEACVTGNSEVKDAPRKDCDVAIIKVTVPPTTPPQQPPQPQPQPQVLPATGAANIVAGAGAVTVLGYVGNLLRLKYFSRKG
jgi:uncharacterized repeat protein (TIGR01451 family)